MKFNPHTLEIELTDICNAACPMCHRTNTFNTKPNDNPPYVTNNTQITFDVFKGIIDRNNPIRYYNFCGNWGDPLTAKDFLQIIEYIAKPDTKIDIHTNGSLRSKEFFKELGRILSINPNNTLIFSVDGLEDTNHIYRRHTDFNKIMENAKSYIDNTEANSVWMYIPFKHNEHQVDEAKALSERMGFTHFALNHSARFTSRGIDRFEFAEDGQTFYLEPPKDSVKIERQSKAISCNAINTKKIYLSCEAKIWPCCWIETSYRLRDDPDLNNILDMSDLDSLDATQHTIEDIMTSDIFQLIEMHWDKDQPKMCKQKCGSMLKNSRKISG